MERRKARREKTYQNRKGFGGGAKATTEPHRDQSHTYNLNKTKRSSRKKRDGVAEASHDSEGGYLSSRNTQETPEDQLGHDMKSKRGRRRKRRDGAEGNIDAARPNDGEDKSSLNYSADPVPDINIDGRVGAFPIQGVDGGPRRTIDGGVFNEDQTTQGPSQFDISTPFDAHLPSENEEILVVEGRHEEKNNGTSRKKKTICVFGVIISTLLIGGSILGAVLGTRSSGGNSSIDNSFDEDMDVDWKESVRMFLTEASINANIEVGPNTTHEMAIEWLLEESGVIAPSAGLSQRFALVLLYYESSNGGTDPWRRCHPNHEACDEEERWLSGADECSWYGVSCEGRVIVEIDLERNDLTGIFPSSIALLPNLRILGMYANSMIVGPIPEGLYDLTSLLAVSIADMPYISGTISTRIGLLTDLITLGWSNCNLSGTVPTEIGRLSQLRYLSFEENALMSGSIPNEVFSLTNLQILSFARTNFGGTVSTLVGQLAALEDFHIHSSFFQGSIPTEIGMCVQLTTLQLLENRLTGTVPSEIGRLSKLERLAIGSNARISGTIPEIFDSLTNLATLSLGETAIGGTLSTKIGLISKLFWLDLRDANISGTLPSEIGLLSQSLNLFYIQDNLLSGAIPSEIGACKTLVDLNVGFNILTGTIPSSIAKLSDLESFVPQFNPNLSGPIPEGLYNLINLAIFGLGGIPLTGTLSTRVGLLTNLEVLSLSDNFITGKIPSEIGLLSNLDTLVLANTTLYGAIPGQVCDFNPLPRVATDCLPSDKPPVSCGCCKICFNRNAVG